MEAEGLEVVPGLSDVYAEVQFRSLRVKVLSALLQNHLGKQSLARKRLVVSSRL